MAFFTLRLSNLWKNGHVLGLSAGQAEICSWGGWMVNLFLLFLVLM